MGAGFTQIMLRPVVIPTRREKQIRNPCNMIQENCFGESMEGGWMQDSRHWFCLEKERDIRRIRRIIDRKQTNRLSITRVREILLYSFTLGFDLLFELNGV